MVGYVLTMFTREPCIGLRVKLDDDHVALVENWRDVFNELGCVVFPCSSYNQSIHNGLHDGPAVVVRVSDAVPALAGVKIGT